MIQVVDELATNIIVHGYRGRPGHIEIEVTQEGNVLVVRLRDQAPLFDPTRAPPPDLTLPLERRRVGGLGIHLTRQFTDSMTYRMTSEGGNELTLRKKGVLGERFALGTVSTFRSQGFSRQNPPKGSTPPDIERQARSNHALKLVPKSKRSPIAGCRNI